MYFFGVVLDYREALVFRWLYYSILIIYLKSRISDVLLPNALFPYIFYAIFIISF